jgi:hypothetical protein
MQIMPSSVQSTTKHTKSESSKTSRRRLFSLLATAAVASGLGIALGSTLRFQVGPVSQAPLFKPQQDFPPLEEWPPALPSVEHNEFDTNWNNEAHSPQLVYNDHYTDQSYTEIEEVKNYNGSAYLYAEEQHAPEETLILEELPSPSPATFSNEDGTITDDEVFQESTLPPVTSTSAGELDDDSDVINTPQLNDVPSTEEAPPWFKKQPLSNPEFSAPPLTDAPVIISPEISTPSSGLPSN